MRKVTSDHFISKNSLIYTALQTNKSLDAKDQSSDMELI